MNLSYNNYSQKTVGKQRIYLQPQQQPKPQQQQQPASPLPQQQRQIFPQNDQCQHTYKY
jgi:hypothetical protein